MTNLGKFTAACIEAMYFTDTGEENQPASDAELADDTRLDLEADCRSFWRRYGCYIEATDMSPEQAGDDFWLTRNGHGAGFWDGDWDHTPYAEMLTKGSEAYGPFETYAGDDGLIYA